MKGIDARGAAAACLDALGGADDGWHCYPFQVSAYNALVSEPFRLLPDNAVGVLVVNDARTFQAQFRPWCARQYAGVESPSVLRAAVHDPIDTFAVEKVQAAARCLRAHTGTSEVVAMHDFSMHMPQRRPMVLMPTVGHAAGCAYYYRPEEFCDEELKRRLCKEGAERHGKKILGLSVHGEFGCWFAYRAVLLLAECADGRLAVRPPTPPIGDKVEVADLLYQFNTTWQDWQWRSCVPNAVPYDGEQRDYFVTPPGERWRLLAKWIGLPCDDVKDGDTVGDEAGVAVAT